ncbi:ribonuclease P protein subunit [Candidatus Micrarchaeota archaeon]|nr:ribonuclease P protein subunit [Candidatus Micrarchaeota archaeon]
MENIIENEKYFKDYATAHEFIGLNVTINSSADFSILGLTGTVVDETLNTLVIQDQDSVKIIPKKNNEFIFHHKTDVNVNGNNILYRSNDRLRNLR